MTQNLKITAGKKFKFFDHKLQFTYPALQNMKFLYFFYFFGVVFALLHPAEKDPCGSGSGSETLLKGLFGRRRCGLSFALGGQRIWADL
jgi:hypothetical protein